MTKVFKMKQKIINIFYVNAGIFTESIFSLTFGSLENHSTFSTSTQEQWTYSLFTNLNLFSFSLCKTHVLFIFICGFYI